MCSGLCHAHRGLLWRSCLLAPAWPSPACYSHLGSELVNSTSLSHPITVFQMNTCKKQNEQKKISDDLKLPQIKGGLHRKKVRAWEDFHVYLTLEQNSRLADSAPSCRLSRKQLLLRQSQRLRIEFSGWNTHKSLYWIKEYETLWF